MEEQGLNSTDMNNKTEKGITVLIKAHIKKIIKDRGFSSSPDFIKGLDYQVDDLLSKAINRARQNGRKRVMIKDL